MLWHQVILSVLSDNLVFSQSTTVVSLFLNSPVAGISTGATGYVVEANLTSMTYVFDCVKAFCVATKRAECARVAATPEDQIYNEETTGPARTSHAPSLARLRPPRPITSGVDKFVGAATATGDATTGGGASNIGSSATVTGGGTLSSGSQSSTATGNATNDAAAKGARKLSLGFVASAALAVNAYNVGELVNRFFLELSHL
ncbi:hypothetical protein SCAR479_13312 [Seiridium cardinale]|uniref:Uncharacterized protein n=1 Tax=Seiridium cardinale TaxID=138064 RepID=A0ABR2X8J7_9PEZI